MVHVWYPWALDEQDEGLELMHVAGSSELHVFPNSLLKNLPHVATTLTTLPNYVLFLYQLAARFQLDFEKQLKLNKLDCKSDQ